MARWSSSPHALEKMSSYFDLPHKFYWLQCSRFQFIDDWWLNHNWHSDIHTNRWDCRKWKGIFVLLKAYWQTWHIFFCKPALLASQKNNPISCQFHNFGFLLRIVIVAKVLVNNICFLANRFRCFHCFSYLANWFSWLCRFCKNGLHCMGSSLILSCKHSSLISGTILYLSVWTSQ